MYKLDVSSKFYPLLTTLIGAASFIVGTILANIIVGDGLMGSIFLPPVLSVLLLGIFIRLSFKGISKALLLSCVYPSLFLIMWVLTEIGIQLGGLTGSIVAIVSLIAVNASFGAMLGGAMYGKRAVKIFSLICGLASLPIILLAQSDQAINSLSRMLSIFGQVKYPVGMEDRVNPNLLPIFTSLGISLGLSIGLYNRWVNDMLIKAEFKSKENIENEDTNTTLKANCTPPSKKIKVAASVANSRVSFKKKQERNGEIAMDSSNIASSNIHKSEGFNESILAYTAIDEALDPDAAKSEEINVAKHDQADLLQSPKKKSYKNTA